MDHMDHMESLALRHLISIFRKIFGDVAGNSTTMWLCPVEVSAAESIGDSFPPHPTHQKHPTAATLHPWDGNHVTPLLSQSTCYVDVICGQKAQAQQPSEQAIRQPGTTRLQSTVRAASELTGRTVGDNPHSTKAPRSVTLSTQTLLETTAALDDELGRYMYATQICPPSPPHSKWSPYYPNG